MSFLRVKRKNEEDPKEAFILASKRTKLQDIDEVPVFELTNSCVQPEDIDTVINNTIEKQSSIKTRAFDMEKLRSKLREGNAERARENKLKVLNHVRKLDASATEKTIPIIDLSDDETDENGNKYVYDLYYSGVVFDFTNPATIEEYCLREIDDEHLYIENESDDEVLIDEDDDSNDENYWKNDYPDEIDEDEDPAEFLSRQLKNSHLNSDYSLSSSEIDDDVERDCYSPRRKDDYYNEVISDSESD